MSDLIPCDVADDTTGQSSAGERQRSDSAAKSPPKSKILTAAECLENLARLPGLLALGFLKPTQVNSLKGVYDTILRDHRQTEGRNAQQGLGNEDVMALLRKDPTMLSLLEPLLTEEQVKLVMEGKGDA